MTIPAHMPLTADDLMASPRGRSLVFELATQPPERVQRQFDAEGETLNAEARAFNELGEAIFLAVYLKDKERGFPVAMYHDSGTSEPPSGAVTSADVAEKLRSTRQMKPSSAAARGAIGAVVDEAKYWEPSSSDEILVEDPEIKAILLPFAQAIVAEGMLDSWSEPVDLRSQWDFEWDDSEVTGKSHPSESASYEIADPTERGAAIANFVAKWTSQMLTSETEYRHDFVKNPYEEVAGGWWSTPPDALWSTTGTWRDGTPIGLELVEDSFGFERARGRRIVLKPEARICEINRPEDWAALCRRYPIDVTAQRHQVWFETTGRKGRWVIPDWSQVAEEFDGVHVSLAGYLRTAGAVIPVGDHSIVPDSESLPTAGDTDEMTASLLAGWNPDTTYWLNDAITGIAEVVDWKLDENSDEWLRR